LSNQLEIYQADLFKALAHPARLQILALLREGERCVCEISPALAMEQSGVSRHLAILKKDGLLEARKEGLKVIYRVKDRRVYQLLDLNAAILKDFWHAKTSLVV
jgi:DNA-binding transcriptional ArsR family regulator